jgi:hypothetical protein
MILRVEPDGTPSEGWKEFAVRRADQHDQEARGAAGGNRPSLPREERSSWSRPNQPHELFWSRFDLRTRLLIAAFA